MLKNSKYKHPAILARKVKTYVTKPSVLFRHSKEVILNKKLERKFIDIFFDTKAEYDAYKKEILDSGLIEDIYKLRNYFLKHVKGTNVSGAKYSMGSVNTPVGIKLYCLIRKYKPEVLVETGVANGVSSSFLLLALHKNKKGKLYSIDYPEVEGKKYSKGDFWEGKQGSVIPKDQSPGWVIPDYLRENWELILGKSQEELPPLLQRLGKVDFFIHDSEHTYECMEFEFEETYKYITDNGFILSDNVNTNNSFEDFCAKYGFIPFNFNKITAIAVDPKKYTV